ncbi:MAG TPA: tryptophan synthase subunit alpha [Polyangiaceae bacterium]|jgi:tryptophan synthase alpha chain|nr:tryptophan synthase subunit alpha [Polyangiaceae bacterium]
MTVERIEQTFARLASEKRTALVAYLCVGDPSVEDSKACALAAVEAGADILEIGVPFSDPTADGPVIAAAAFRAIQNGGSLTAALDVVRTVRAKSNAPMVLFTYYNPILAFGESKLPAAAREAGVDAFLVVDLPPEEGAELRRGAREAGVGFIPLIAPTSDTAREDAGFATASGFVYYVSLTGVTGSAHVSMDDASRRANAVRDRARLPVVVGFGIDSREKARAAHSHGVSGIAVGTAVVKAIANGKDRDARVSAVKALISELRAGLDGA